MYLPLIECMIFGYILNYVQVTYLGKELLKYISEEIPVPPEPDVVPQQHQPCLPGMCCVVLCCIVLCAANILMIIV